MSERQTTADVMMIRPAHFAGNDQTVHSNHFQRPDLAHANAAQAAREEFDALVAKLRAARVRVHVFEDTLEPNTPDAVFPNNWISFHADGTVVLYPMLALNRRLERRTDVVEKLGSQGVLGKVRVVDLSALETAGKFVEGTGSLVLDRENRIAYAARSSRTHDDAVQEFAHRLGYSTEIFDAADDRGAPIYHTNVLMSIGTRFCILCAQAIDGVQRARVLQRLLATGRTIVDISPAQMKQYAANVIELATADERSVLVLSQRAHRALSATQRETLQALSGPLIASPLTTIEDLGGGSARCMIAEIHGATCSE